MSAVDRPDNGQDEGLHQRFVAETPPPPGSADFCGYCLQDWPCTPARAREQQREQIAGLLREHWSTPTSACTCGGVQLGQDWTLHVADQLLALLAHTDEGTSDA